ncbi:hypothetical protein SAY86_024164 [Trapa natans]|uniref:non-specific serine/threonine protein kinase n=1 Tax=Trapa natans TaxID=22666 RepID=A0AAN7R6E6_TRANT|nr:hypothetical protein SAY86_024164 [Trapa natans]
MSRPSANLHKSKTLDNKYMLGDEIGKGAYGRVYKGLDLENGDFVAIKQVSLENIAQEDLNTIMQEIDLLKNLNHKNIVTYLGSLKTKTHLHIVLEYVENGSLADIIKPNKFGPFPESLVAVYIAQVLEGLVYLHEQGVIHRDIKGANILTTKEGLVKLADFGVATKLNEADVNTHSVVGTPYWMAPEVIEMSGVCAASDIWGVGCTVIELLTCVPPYYDLPPMPALYRIVRDDHPPLPDSLSPDITDFLHQCFKKDARQRPDAKTLLSHPWIQNCRHALHSSLRHSGTLRNIQEDIPMGSEISEADNQHLGKTPVIEEVNIIVSKIETASGKEKHDEGIETGRAVMLKASDETHGEVKTVDLENDPLSDQDLTLAIFDESSAQSSSENLTSKAETNVSNKLTPHENSDKNMDQTLVNGEMEYSESGTGDILKNEETGSPKYTGSNMFGNRNRDGVLKMVTKMSVNVGVNELCRFSDSPGDASLDDLFQPEYKAVLDGAGEASSSLSTSHANLINDNVPDAMKNDLATKLRATIAQKQTENEIVQSSGGVNLLRLMMDALKDDAIDIDGLVFDEKLSGEHLFPLQAVEFGRLVASLRPEEPEEVIVSACQKLIALFHQRPDQKLVFFSQHGLLPLMELLELPNNRVIASVLQIINKIIKDNKDFQENACLIGLIPVVMSFAAPTQPREVRLEAAYFFQQLCQFSSLTLQMFIACRGIPVLVGFLEADYAKYREMVHLAIDGLWQVFKLQRTTPRNEFCHIATKNGILLRLINALYSLNEATRLASLSGDSILPLDGQEPSHALTSQTQGSDLPSQLNVETDGGLNGFSASTSSHPQQVHPLLGLLEKEPPSRYLSGLERHETIMPVLHATNDKNMNGDKKTNVELDLLRPDFTEVSNHGQENGNNLDLMQTTSQGMTLHKKTGQLLATDGVASSSGIFSQTTSGMLSGSGVLNARPASTASSGLLLQMVSTMNADVSREYLEKVADLLLEFAQADTTVKSRMCSQGLLNRLFQMFDRVTHPILLKILMCINHLSMDPNCLESLQRAEAIKYLIPNLEIKDGPLIDEIHHEVLNALFNLCKINKRRQEQAAENGIIPHLMHFILSDSPLKKWALPLLCDMAHASRNSREQLRAHGGLEVYLRLLDDLLWSVTALDSIAVCLAHDSDNRKVEHILLKEDAIKKLVSFFQCCPEQYFVHILEPFLKIITKSSRINTTLAVNGLTPLLVTRLDHQDAIARLNLLKLIKAVYEHHPRPKQLIVENNLPQKLQNLIEERRDGQRSGGQVLVKQMATSLLKALHINTVL